LFDQSFLSQPALHLTVGAQFKFNIFWTCRVKVCDNVPNVAYAGLVQLNVVAARQLPALARPFLPFGGGRASEPRDEHGRMKILTRFLKPMDGDETKISGSQGSPKRLQPRPKPLPCFFWSRVRPECQKAKPNPREALKPIFKIFTPFLRFHFFLPISGRLFRASDHAPHCK
jgi:hypothetical protein